MSTFGPAYDEQIDGKRVAYQMDRVKAHLANHKWWTLAELALYTGDPESSISAQIRHLRKPRFGGHTIEKRRRACSGGTWEYRMRPTKVLDNGEPVRV